MVTKMMNKTEQKKAQERLAREYIYDSVRPRLYPASSLPELKRRGILCVEWNGVLLTFWAPGKGGTEMIELRDDLAACLGLNLDELQECAVRHNREDFPVDGPVSGEVVSIVAGRQRHVYIAQ